MKLLKNPNSTFSSTTITNANVTEVNSANELNTRTKTTFVESREYMTNNKIFVDLTSNPNLERNKITKVTEQVPTLNRALINSRGSTSGGRSR